MRQEIIDGEYFIELGYEDKEWLKKMFPEGVDDNDEIDISFHKKRKWLYPCFNNEKIYQIFVFSGREINEILNKKDRK